MSTTEIGLLIALCCVSFALIFVFFFVGIKWIFLITDFKSKKDYLREISNNLEKYMYRMDKIIITNQDFINYLNKERKD